MYVMYNVSYCFPFTLLHYILISTLFYFIIQLHSFIFQQNICAIDHFIKHTFI